MKKVNVIIEKKEGREASFLKVYPKASDDIVWLESDELLQIIIYNSAGKIMVNRKSKTVKTKINVTNYASGLYWIKAQSKSTTFTDKFIKL